MTETTNLVVNASPEYVEAVAAPGRMARVRSAGRNARRAMLSTAGVVGSTRELATVGSFVAAYPLGVAREKKRPESTRLRLDDLPPKQRGLVINDVVAAGTPIVLVHGLFENRSIFRVARRHLAHRGFGRVVTHNYSVLTTDIRRAAAGLAAVVERLCEETGYERVHVVGHSLGGLIARYYVQRLGGDARVHTVVTLGSPHTGTVAAHLLPTPVCRQMRPGSDLLAELDEPAPGISTRFVAFWSDLDELIIPQAAAKITHPDLAARNILMRGVGHLAIARHPKVLNEITTALAFLEPDGSTKAGGAVLISSTSGR